MILVIYAVVAFLFFNKFFQDDSQNLRCGTMFECLVTVVMLGSLSNPPLGDVSFDNMLVIENFPPNIFLSNSEHQNFQRQQFCDHSPFALQYLILCDRDNVGTEHCHRYPRG